MPTIGYDVVAAQHIGACVPIASSYHVVLGITVHGTGNPWYDMVLRTVPKHCLSTQSIDASTLCHSVLWHMLLVRVAHVHSVSSSVLLLHWLRDTECGHGSDHYSESC